MKKKPKIEFLIDTDIMQHHLTCDSDSEKSYLVELMQKGLCFTTVLNAAELMLNSKNDEEEFYVKSMLSSLKVLGIHSRYSLSVKQLHKKIHGLRDSLFLATAEINKLNIISLNSTNYESKKIKILHPDQLLN